MGKRVTKKLADLRGSGDRVADGARRQLISARNLSLRYIGIHDDVRSVYEAFELLNPATVDRPAEMPIRSLHCVALSRPPGIEIVTGFHDYRRIPNAGEVPCFAEPPDSGDEADLRVLAWDYVFATTPWPALSNKVLSLFYRHFAKHVPAAVLHSYVPTGSLKRDLSELTPSAMELLSGISRKTLHRLRKPSIRRGVRHLPQRKLPTGLSEGEDQ